MRKNSICYPVYNAEKYLKEAIKPIINRTYKNIKLILVDDCTNDNNFNIYKRIVIYKNNYNLSVLDTEMKAISLSTGDYVLFLDNDDYYERNAIEIIDNSINDSINLMIYGSNKFKDKVMIISLGYKNEIYNEDNRNEFLLRVATNNNYNSWWQKYIKGNIASSIFNDEKDYDIFRVNDKYFSALLYKQINNVMFINEGLYNWCDNFFGITRKGEVEYREKVEIADLIYNDFSTSIEDKNKYDYYQIKELKAQLSKISCFPVGDKIKINFLYDIKQSDYYNDILIKLFNIMKLLLKIILFISGKYLLLTNIANLRKRYIY